MRDKNQAGGQDRSPDFFTNVQIRFPLTFSFVGIVILVLLTAWYAHNTGSTKDTLSFFVIGVAAVGQVTVSIYTARMLSTTLSDRRNSEAAQARSYAMQVGARFNDPSMYHVRDAMREILDHQGSHDDIVAFCDTRRTNVIHLFNFLEEIATALHENMVDPALIKRQFSSVIVASWSKAWPWIQAHRSRRGQPDIWEDLERTYDDWKKDTTRPK